MTPKYLSLSDAAALLKVSIHHVKHLVATADLRCGVFALGWHGNALPPLPHRGGGFKGGVCDINPRDHRDQTFRFDNPETGDSFEVRTAVVSQFWYLHHSSVYPFCINGAEAIEDFLLEPVDGESLHAEDPERFPWPEFVFWPFRDKQEAPVRATWEDILFLAGDVEALRDVEASSGGQMDGGDRNALLKTIGVLALALAEKSKKYRRGEKPNASEIAKAVEEIIDGLPYANRYGLGNSSVRERIANGLKGLGG